MDARQFDRIARILAERRLSRRRALASGGAGMVAGVALTSAATPSTVAAQEATPVAGAEVELLYLQSFGSGSITPAEGGAGTCSLTLEDTLGETMYFSDRPNRVVGAMPTADFVAAFEAAADDPPNAALVAGDMTLVVELTSTTFDQAAGTLTYEATVLGEGDVAGEYMRPPSEAPTEEMTLDTCHLFIDGFDPCCDPIHRPWCC